MYKQNELQLTNYQWNNIFWYQFTPCIWYRLLYLRSLNRIEFFIRIAILYKYVASKRFKTINLFASESSYIIGTIPYRGELLNQFVYSFALWSDTTDSSRAVFLTYICGSSISSWKYMVYFFFYFSWVSWEFLIGRTSTFSARGSTLRNIAFFGNIEWGRLSINIERIVAPHNDLDYCYIFWSVNDRTTKWSTNIK